MLKQTVQKKTKEFDYYLWIVFFICIVLHNFHKLLFFLFCFLNCNAHCIFMLSFSTLQITFRGQDPLKTPVKLPFLDAPAFPTRAALTAVPACRPMARRMTAQARCSTSTEQTWVSAHLYLSVMPFAPAVTIALTGWCREGCGLGCKCTKPGTGAGEPRH